MVMQFRNGNYPDMSNKKTCILIERERTQICYLRENKIILEIQKEGLIECASYAGCMNIESHIHIFREY